MQRLGIVMIFGFISCFACFNIGAEEDIRAVKLVYAFPQLSFDRPVDLQDPHDGVRQLFVVEQAGRIRTFKNNITAVHGNRRTNA